MWTSTKTTLIGRTEILFALFTNNKHYVLHNIAVTGHRQQVSSMLSYLAIHGPR